MSSSEVPTCLVTGANGFLGRALVQRLSSDGEYVRAFVRTDMGLFRDNLSVQIVVGDLSDSVIVDRAVQGVRSVFHAGATMRGSSEAFIKGTVVGTRNVVDACVAHRIPRLVQVSSLSVLDHAGSQDETVITERACLEPLPHLRGLYTQTKLQAEQIVLNAVRDRSLNAVVIRPGHIFGPGSESVVPAGFIGLGRNWVCVGDGSLNLPLVYRDDAVDALVLARSPDLESGTVVHVVDSEKVSQREYASAAAASGAGPQRVFFCPARVMLLVAAGVEGACRMVGRLAPLTRYRVESIRPLQGFDVSLARELLHWTPHVGVAEGMGRTFGVSLRRVPGP